MWTLGWEVTVSSVASMMNSGRNCLFKTLSSIPLFFVHLGSFYLNGNTFVGFGPQAQKTKSPSVAW